MRYSIYVCIDINVFVCVCIYMYKGGAAGQVELRLRGNKNEIIGMEINTCMYICM